MRETKKNVILRVFQTAVAIRGNIYSKYPVLQSASCCPVFRSILCTELFGYFWLASLEGISVNSGEVWTWGAITVGSIALGIVLSVIGSFLCHACAFNALYDLRMRILDHMGKLNLGFYTGGQSGAVQKMMNENIEKMENIIAHDVSKHLWRQVCC